MDWYFHKVNYLDEKVSDHLSFFKECNSIKLNNKSTKRRYFKVMWAEVGRCEEVIKLAWGFGGASYVVCNCINKIYHNMGMPQCWNRTKFDYV